MTDPVPSEEQLGGGRRVRRPYLFHVFAGPWVVGLLGVALLVAAFVSSQPTPIRVTALPVGAVMLIVGALMPRISGPLELSVLQSSFKANLDALLPDALLLAHEAAVQAQPPDDPNKEAKAQSAVAEAIRIIADQVDERSRQQMAERARNELMNRWLRQAYREALQRRAEEARRKRQAEAQPAPGDGQQP